jgi:hypothetical protein
MLLSRHSRQDQPTLEGPFNSDGTGEDKFAFAKTKKSHALKEQFAIRYTGLSSKWPRLVPPATSQKSRSSVVIIRSGWTCWLTFSLFYPFHHSRFYPRRNRHNTLHQYVPADQLWSWKSWDPIAIVQTALTSVGEREGQKKGTYFESWIFRCRDEHAWIGRPRYTINSGYMTSQRSDEPIEGQT